jgi:hypothetical protein
MVYSDAMEPADDADPPQGPLRVCARFLREPDAEIFAARLQAEGIVAHVMGAHSLYSEGFAGGFGTAGIRVMVAESQLPDAQRILAAYNAGEYAIDENFDPDRPG